MPAKSSAPAGESLDDQVAIVPPSDFVGTSRVRNRSDPKRLLGRMFGLGRAQNLHPAAEFAISMVSTAKLNRRIFALRRCPAIARRWQHKSPFIEKHLATNRDRLSHAAALARSASSTRGQEGIKMMSQAEIGLVKIDENMTDADRYIRELGSLVPLLAARGYPTAEIEEILTMLWQVLHRLQVQRRAIVEMLDGDELPPRIAQPAKRTRR
jgi:hypothetical protein